jgi:hypothetical protein
VCRSSTIVQGYRGSKGIQDYRSRTVVKEQYRSGLQE